VIFPIDSFLFNMIRYNERDGLLVLMVGALWRLGYNGTGRENNGQIATYRLREQCTNYRFNYCFSNIYFRLLPIMDTTWSRKTGEETRRNTLLCNQFTLGYAGIFGRIRKKRIAKVRLVHQATSGLFIKQKATIKTP
jgi:hypothetical protein